MSISKYKIKEKAKRNKKSITLSVEKGGFGWAAAGSRPKNGECKYLGKPNNEVLFTMAQACKKSRTRLFI